MAEPEIAVAQLKQAVSLAYELGLNHEDFPHSRSSLLAESARRTWWEIYVVDGLLAGFRHKPSLLRHAASMDTMLPCEENAYESARIPIPTWSFRHLRRRVLLGQEDVSSYSLRVEAISILHRTMAANKDSYEPQDLHSLDGLLSTWTSCLPDSKVDPAPEDCDHMLFQAQMVIFAASVLLHLPRSGIFNFESSTPVACTKPNQHLPSFMNLNMHATKAMKASQDLSKLASLDLVGHTPFFACTLALIAVVHLSAIAVHGEQYSDQNYDRLNQVFGILKREGRVWPLATNTQTQLRATVSVGSDGPDQFTADISIPLESLETLFGHAWSMQFDAQSTSR